MKFTKEVSLEQFEFWSQAKKNAKYFTDEKMNTIEAILEDLSYDGNIMSETDINDLFWHEPDVIAKWLGYESFEDIYQERKEDV